MSLPRLNAGACVQPVATPIGHGSPCNGCLCTRVWCMGVVLVYLLLQWGTFAFHAMFWPGMMSLLTIIVGKW